MAVRRADGEKTRAKVLDVALPLFAAHGFAGTSIRMISSAAGVNVATLAYHFEDKEGLYRTVVQRLHHDLARSFPTSPPQLGDLDALLRWYLDSAWTFCVEHREHNRLLLRHVLDRGALPDVVMENWTDVLMGRAVEVLQMFRPELDAVRARVMVSAIQHLLVRFTLEDPAQFSLIVGSDGHDLSVEIVDFLEDLVRSQLGLPALSRS